MVVVTPAPVVVTPAPVLPPVVAPAAPTLPPALAAGPLGGVNAKIRDAFKKPYDQMKTDFQTFGNKVKTQEKQVENKVRAMPVMERAGIVAGSAVGVAALAGAVGGIAKAVHDAKDAKTTTFEYHELHARKFTTTQKVHIVQVPVMVPVTPPPDPAFALKRYAKEDVQPAYRKVDEPHQKFEEGHSMVMGAAGFFFFAFFFLGISGLAYYKMRKSSRNFSRSQPMHSPREMQAPTVPYEDNEPLLA